jgi:hypothetical protein
MEAKTIFTTVGSENPNDTWCMDYPKNAPLPRIGETALINGKGGIVKDVRHVLQDDLLMIKVIVE